MSLVSEEKQYSECSQIFHFNSGEVKQRNERSQRFHFNSSEVSVVKGPGKHLCWSLFSIKLQG